MPVGNKFQLGKMSIDFQFWPLKKTGRKIKVS